MSSGGLLEFAEGSVAGRLVGGVVLPAAPDDVRPGASEDALSVGVSFAVGAELTVPVGGPFVAVTGVAGE